MKRTLTLFTLLFVTEIAIAVFHFHAFIRGFLGDVLAIPLLYYFLRIFIRWHTLYLVLTVVAIAVGLETIQYTHILEKFQTQSTFLKTILGTTFDWKDIVAYIIGGACTLLFEKYNSYGKD